MSPALTKFERQIFANSGTARNDRKKRLATGQFDGHQECRVGFAIGQVDRRQGFDIGVDFRWRDDVDPQFRQVVATDQAGDSALKVSEKILIDVPFPFLP